jgi:hypothetical protein
MSNSWILGLAEKPKVGELQMDWLRSEDLKEESKITASLVIIAVPQRPDAAGAPDRRGRGPHTSKVKSRFLAALGMTNLRSE